MCNMAEQEDCSRYLLAHDSEIKRNSDNIQEIWDVIKPLGTLETTLKTLGEEVKKLNTAIEKMEDKYINKDLFLSYVQRRDDQWKASQKEIDALIDNQKWVTRGMVGGIIYILYDIFKVVGRQ